MSLRTEGVVEATVACIDGQITALYQDPWAPSLSTLLARLAQPTGRAWIFRQADSVVAVAWFSIVSDEAELLDIRVASLVSSAWFLAGSLLRFALNVLHHEQIVECHLEVRASNDAAIALYEQLGFTTSGSRANYYPSVSGARRCDSHGPDNERSGTLMKVLETDFWCFATPS